LLNASEGDCIANVDAKEARRILSGLARGSDPSIRIRAVESLGKMDEREEAARAETASNDPERTLGEIAQISPLLAAFLSKRHGLNFVPDVASARRELGQLAQFVNELAATGPSPAEVCCTAR
jgi:hypothetical protein